jgi:hypothetical protein
MVHAQPDDSAAGNRPVTTTGAGTGPSAGGIDDLAEDLHKLLRRVREGGEPADSEILDELASRALKVASLYEKSAAGGTITRLRDLASQLEEHAAGQRRAST